MLGSCRIAVAMGLFTSMLVALDKQAAAQIAGPTTHAGSDDPLLTLNKSSQALYAQAKIAALDHHGPVIIVSGDDLVLRNGEKRVQVRVTPEIYHTLKAIAHVPMAIDVALTAHWQEVHALHRFSSGASRLPRPPVPGRRTHCNSRAERRRSRASDGDSRGQQCVP